MGALTGDIERTETISVKSYKGTLLLGTIPIVGDILLFIWSKDKEIRENKRNLCKAYIQIKLMLIYPVSVVLVVFAYIIGSSGGFRI